MQGTEKKLAAHTMVAMSVPSGHAMAVRLADGSSFNFKEGGAMEFVVTPILNYEGTVIVNGATVNYICKISPRAFPGMVEKNFAREMTTKMKNFFSAAIQEQALSLIEKQSEEGGLTLDVEYDKGHYSALVKFVA